MRLGLFLRSLFAAGPEFASIWCSRIVSFLPPSACLFLRLARVFSTNLPPFVACIVSCLSWSFVFMLLCLIMCLALPRATARISCLCLPSSVPSPLAHALALPLPLPLLSSVSPSPRCGCSLPDSQFADAFCACAAHQNVVHILFLRCLISSPSPSPNRFQPHNPSTSSLPPTASVGVPFHRQQIGPFYYNRLRHSKSSVLDQALQELPIFVSFIRARRCWSSVDFGIGFCARAGTDDFLRRTTPSLYSNTPSPRPWTALDI